MKKLLAVSVLAAAVAVAGVATAHAAASAAHSAPTASASRGATPRSKSRSPGNAIFVARSSSPLTSTAPATFPHSAAGARL